MLLVDGMQYSFYTTTGRYEFIVQEYKITFSGVLQSEVLPLAFLVTLLLAVELLRQFFPSVAMSARTQFTLSIVPL